MGMAASQARYLGVTARKTNDEYEGQQINQQRTALSNESAGLFNQLLGLDVPIPPSTADFSQIQYTFNDGLYEEAIDNYAPLPTTDPDYGTYNYTVTYTHDQSTYTGVDSLNADPKVVATRNVNFANTVDPVTFITTNAYTNYINNTNPTGNYTYTKVGNYVLSDYDPTNATQLAEMTQIVADNPAPSNIAAAFAAGGGGIHYYTIGTGSSAKREYVCEADMQASIDTNVGDNRDTIPTCWTDVTVLTGTDTTGTAYNLGVYDYVNRYGTATSIAGTSYVSATGRIYDTVLNAQNDDGVTGYQNVMNGVTQAAGSDTSSTGVIQTTLNDYYAAYLDKQVTTTQKAFMDTATSSSRFNNITLQSSPNTTFNVNAATTTDEDAYNDAMNQYEYNTAVYEKQVQDINARTSIIQVEDRTLELRLKQLDTEQEALQTEMESLKKVIDKNIESTFKTFQ